MNNLGLSQEQMLNFSREDLVAYINKIVDWLGDRLGNMTDIARYKLIEHYTKPTRDRENMWLRKYLEVRETA